jgi:hypothetical protein
MIFDFRQRTDQPRAEPILDLDYPDENADEAE